MKRRVKAITARTHTVFSRNGAKANGSVRRRTKKRVNREVSAVREVLAVRAVTPAGTMGAKEAITVAIREAVIMEVTTGVTTVAILTFPTIRTTRTIRSHTTRTTRLTTTILPTIHTLIKDNEKEKPA